VVVCLSGEIDLASAPVVRVALAQAVSAAALRVDLSAVEFMDVAGARPLMELRRQGHRIRLLRPRPSVERVLRLMGLADLIEVPS
jgi:anti-anti-sigma factor